MTAVPFLEGKSLPSYKEKVGESREGNERGWPGCEPGPTAGGSSLPPAAFSWFPVDYSAAATFS